jgi:hypothetical protein
MLLQAKFLSRQLLGALGGERCYLRAYKQFDFMLALSQDLSQIGEHGRLLDGIRSAVDKGQARKVGNCFLSCLAGQAIETGAQEIILTLVCLDNNFVGEHEVGVVPAVCFHPGNRAINVAVRQSDASRGIYRLRGEKSFRDARIFICVTCDVIADDIQIRMGCVYEIPPGMMESRLGIERQDLILPAAELSSGFRRKEGQEVRPGNSSANVGIRARTEILDHHLLNG